jgi:hypothetical protein
MYIPGDWKLIVLSLFQMVQAIQVLRFHLLELEKVSLKYKKILDHEHKAIQATKGVQVLNFIAPVNYTNDRVAQNHGAAVNHTHRKNPKKSFDLSVSALVFGV